MLGWRIYTLCEIIKEIKFAIQIKSHFLINKNHTK